MEGILSSNCSQIIDFKTSLNPTTTLHVGRRGELAVQIQPSDVTSTSPLPVKWTHNNVDVTATERIHLLVLDEGWHKLVFDEVLVADGGLYSAYTSNEHSKQHSSTFVKLKSAPPLISSLCKDTTKVKSGERMCIVVSVKDYGEDYRVHWFKDGLKIHNVTGKLVMLKKRHMCALKFTYVDVEDTGGYKCVVMGSEEESSIDFTISVTDTEDECVLPHARTSEQKEVMSASLSNLLDITVGQEEIFRPAFNIQDCDISTMKSQHNDDHHFPDIYSSLNTIYKKDEMPSKPVTSSNSFKSLFQEAFQYSKRSNNKVQQKKLKKLSGKHSTCEKLCKRKSWSSLADICRSSSNSQQCNGTQQCNGSRNPTLKARCASLSTLLDRKHSKEKTLPSYNKDICSTSGYLGDEQQHSRSRYLTVPSRCASLSTLLDQKPNNEELFKHTSCINDSSMHTSKDDGNSMEGNTSQSSNKNERGMSPLKKCRSLANVFKDTLNFKSKARTDTLHKSKSSTDIDRDSDSSTMTNRSHSTMQKSRSLVKTLRKSIGRGISKAKSCVGLERKESLTEQQSNTNHIGSSTDICDGERNTVSNINRSNEDLLFVASLSDANKKDLEEILHNKVSGTHKWKQLYRTLKDKGLVNSDQQEIHVCRDPNCINIGKELIKTLETWKPDFSVKEFRRIATKRKRGDISEMLEQFEELNLSEMPCTGREKLELLVGSCPVISDITWKGLAEDLQFSSENMNAIEAISCKVSHPSVIEEMFDVFESRHPELSLQLIVETLRELHFDDSADLLTEIITEIQFKQRALRDCSTSTPVHETLNDIDVPVTTVVSRQVYV